jgi:hypothetical protein
MLLSDRLFDGRHVATSPGGYPSRQWDRLPEVTDSLVCHDLRFVILEMAAGDRAGMRGSLDLDCVVHYWGGRAVLCTGIERCGGIWCLCTDSVRQRPCTNLRTTV